MSQVVVHPKQKILYQSMSHPRRLVPILHLSLVQVQLITQANHISINPQTYLLHYYDSNILIILALYHHMSLSGQGILLHHLHLFQAQVHLLIQVKIQATNHQGFPSQTNQKSLLIFIALAHHMCQVDIHPKLQVLYQPLSNHKNLVQHMHWN